MYTNYQTDADSDPVFTGKITVCVAIPTSVWRAKSDFIDRDGLHCLRIAKGIMQESRKHDMESVFACERLAQRLSILDDSYQKNDESFVYRDMKRERAGE
jgi:hypothetical protein